MWPFIDKYYGLIRFRLFSRFIFNCFLFKFHVFSIFYISFFFSLLCEGTCNPLCVKYNFLIQLIMRLFIALMNIINVDVFMALLNDDTFTSFDVEIFLSSRRQLNYIS